MRVQCATHIILLVLLVLTAGAAETRQEDRRQALGTLSNMEEHQAVQLGTASWQSVRASSFLNQLKQIRLRLKDTAALLARQPPAGAMKNLTPNQEKHGNINITPPPQRTLALAQQRTNDISNEVISLVSEFQQEAEQNSNSENLRNLGELKSLQSQMKNALHAAGMKTSSEKVGAENQGFSGQFDRKGETIGDLSAQAAPAPPAFVPQVTEAKPQPQMDESDVIHQIDEQISRLDKIQQVAGDPDRAPRSKAVESSGITEKVAPQNLRNDFLSKESTVVNQSPAQSEGGAEDGSRYDNIQEQLRLLQEMLPKIEDAGQRAGLLQQFAPKIEDQMNSLEQKIQNEEKSSESVERSPVPGPSSRGQARQAPQPQPISVPAAVQSSSHMRAKKQSPMNKLHQAGSKQKSKKTEEDSRDESSDIDRKIEETKAKIEQAKDEGNTAEAEDGEEDETVIFSSRKANARQTPSSSSDEPASSYHEASSTKSTGGSAKAASEEEEQGAGSTAQSSNPIESSIQDALKIKKDEMHHKKDKNFVESSIQQALRIKDLEAKIARLEDKQKSNAQIISQQNMMQQLVMPSIITLSQRVMDMEKQSKGGSDHATVPMEKITSAAPFEKSTTTFSSAPSQFLVSSARPNSMMQRVSDEKSDQDEAAASNDIADKLESLNEGLSKIVKTHHGEKQKKRKDRKRLQQRDIGGSTQSADSARADQAKISKVMELVDRIKKIVKGGDGASGNAETTTSSDYLVPDQISEQTTINKMTDIVEKDDGQSPEMMASSKSSKKMSKQKYRQHVHEELDLADKQAATQNELVKSLPMKEFEI